MPYGVNKYKIGDKVRNLDGLDGNVINWREHAPPFQYKVRFTADSTEFWCNESDLTPIPSTISTPEMITALMENDKVEAKEDGGCVVFNDNGNIMWKDPFAAHPFLFHRDKLNVKWTLIYPSEPKAVEFLTAVNRGKKIKPAQDFCRDFLYEEIAFWFRYFEHSSYEHMQKLINGKWLIQEENK